MRRYRETNHDTIFEDRWTCKNCKAKGPQLNTIKWIKSSEHNKRTGTDDDDDGHEHKRRKTEYEEEDNE
eukprot:15651321-Heterocapsa_arctica.AAC.1